MPTPAGSTVGGREAAKAVGPRNEWRGTEPAGGLAGEQILAETKHQTPQRRPEELAAWNGC